MVARTEATKSVNAGAVEAMRTAEIEYGLEVEKVWITAGDDHVRDSHAELDGTAIGLDETFTITVAEGRKGEETLRALQAQHPGDFGTPGTDGNCRCTVIPRLVGA